MADEGFVFAAVAAGGVRGEVAIRRGEQRVVVGQGLGVGDVEPGGGELSAVERAGEGVLLDGGAAADVVEDGAAFHLREPFIVDEMAGGGVVGEDVEHVIGLRESGGELLGRDHGQAFVAARLAAQGGDLHFERREQFYKMRGDGAIAEDDGGLAARRDAGLPDGEPFRGAVGGVGAQGLRQAAGLREEEGEGVFGASFGVDRGAVGYDQFAFGSEGAEFRGVVARVAGGTEMQPAQVPGLGEAGDVGLAEGDFGFAEGGIGLRFMEDGGGEFLRADEFVRSDAFAQEFQGAFVHGRIGENFHWRRI